MTISGLLRAGLLMVALAATGCVGYGQVISPVEKHLQAHQPEQALAVLEKQSFPDRNRLLYLLDKAMLLRMSGDLVASNAHFEQAKQEMERLEALSLREQAGAVTINDAMRSYGGARFEKILLHVYSALNYLELQQPQQARVEVLQLDVLLRRDDKGEPYAAFARYVSGLVFEAQGEWSDAMIAYRKAYEDYRQSGKPGLIPGYLQSDLLRLSKQLGLNDEYRRYQEEFNKSAEATAPSELIFLLHNGLVPRKREQNVLVQDPGSGRLISIATPYYETREPHIRGLQIVVEDARQPGQVMAQLDRLALNNLAAEMPGIMSRTLARVVTKTTVSKKVQDRDPLAGLLVNVAGVLTEHADMRGWYTLPQNIMMARLPLAAGRYRIRVELQERSGRNQVRELTEVEIADGARRFVSLHWPASTVTKWRP